MPTELPKRPYYYKTFWITLHVEVFRKVRVFERKPLQLEIEGEPIVSFAGTHFRLSELANQMMLDEADDIEEETRADIADGIHVHGLRRDG